MRNNLSVADCEKYLLQDGVIIAQTETIFGLSCAFNSLLGRQKICNLKQRELDMPLSVLVNDMNMAMRYADFDEFAQEISNLLWPYSTFILPANQNMQAQYPFAYSINQDNYGTIGIRQTQAQKACQLIELLDMPICSTSVNINTHPFAKTLEESLDIFDLPYLEFDSELQMSNAPSLIIDLSDEEEVKVIRNNLEIMLDEDAKKHFIQLCEKYNKTLIQN